MPYRPQNTFPLCSTDVKKSLSLSLSLSLYMYIYNYFPLLLRPESKVVKPMKTMISMNRHVFRCFPTAPVNQEPFEWLRSYSDLKEFITCGKDAGSLLATDPRCLCLRFRFGIQIPWDGHISPPPSTGNIGMINALLQAN